MTTEDIQDIPKVNPEDNPDIQDIPEDNPDIPHIPVDSYDELAMDTVQVAEEVTDDVPQTTKRGRGRPPGSRNRPKLPEPEPELEPETPQPTKRKKARPVPLVPPSDVEFTEGYGAAGPRKKAVRMSREMSREMSSSQQTTSGRTLLDLVAQASNQHAERERDRRRTFYENYLPI